MNDNRPGTLSDYLRVLRRSHLLVIAVTVLCAGIAAGRAFSQKPTYVAAAEVTFQEQSSSAAAAGVNVLQTLTPAQLAAAGASMMLSNAVLEPVRQNLKTSLSVAQLRGMLTATVDPSSALVILQGTATDRDFVAALVNGVAGSSVTIQTATARRSFASAARGLANQYRGLRARSRPGASTDVALASLLDRLTALQTLSLNATPASVVSQATAPQSPTSPKPLRSTVFGGLIGFVLAIGLAFGRNSLDRRLRDVSDIHETLEMTVVGSVRDEALGHAAYVTNGRGLMTEQDVESFRIIRTNIGFLDVDSPAKSILVTSPQPGEGKSTVAASLATAYAAAGKRTLLVECDLRRPCFSDRLPVKQSPGLSDYLAGQAEVASIVQLVTLAPAGVQPQQPEGLLGMSARPEPVSLEVITAGAIPIRPAEMLGSVRFGEFIDDVAARYDMVVIDTPPLLSVSDTLEMIPLADSVLLCIRVDQTTRDQARAVKEALAHLPTRATAVVVTGLKRGRESDYGYYSYGY